MNKRQNYDEELKEIIELREQGFKLDEISEITGIKRGTVSCRLSRAKSRGLIEWDDARKNNGRKPEESANTITAANPQPVIVKEKTLNDFQPRELIKHLYNLGYRIKDNSLYVITMQKVNIQSVINE